MKNSTHQSAAALRCSSVSALVVSGSPSWGTMNLDDQRRSFGASAIVVGFVAACIGLGLWWLTGFPSTWGWLI